MQTLPQIVSGTTQEAEDQAAELFGLIAPEIIRLSRPASQFDLAKTTIGLLGMAFKANIDDPRSSLSYKLKRLFALRAHWILTTDPFVFNDPDIQPSNP